MMARDIYEGRDKAAIGARLRLTRSAVGMDQAEFARNAGIKPNTYNQYEQGINAPQIAAGHALCDTYRVTLDWIYRGEMSGLSQQMHSAIARGEMSGGSVLPTIDC